MPRLFGAACFLDAGLTRKVPNRYPPNQDTLPSVFYCGALLRCRLPLDCLYDVSRRKMRRHVEGIRQFIDASSNVDQVALVIETQLMIFAEIDEHPCVRRSRRPRLSPQQYAYLG